MVSGSLPGGAVKAKFRAMYIAKKNKGEQDLQGCWDRVIGVDPEAELAIEDAGFDQVKREKGKKLSVVEAARQRRMQQARRERLPEASLLMAEHVHQGNLDGRLQIRGDPGSLMML